MTDLLVLVAACGFYLWVAVVVGGMRSS